MDDDRVGVYGLPPDKLGEHARALADLGLRAVIVEDPDRFSSDGGRLLVLPLASSFDCARISGLRDSHPTLALVAAVGTVDGASLTRALRCGAQAAVDFVMPAEVAAEIVRCAGLGLSALPYAVASDALGGPSSPVPGVWLDDQGGSVAAERDLSWWRQLVEQSVGPVAILGASGELQYANPVTEELLGYPREYWQGREIFDLVHPDDRERARGAFVSTRSGGGVKIPIELRLVRADGTSLIAEVVANNRLEDPGVRGVIFYIHDVTGRKANETALAHRLLHDELTGLANRRLLLDRLGEALVDRASGGPQVALLYIDLDGFKSVNDTIGHLGGDELLVRAAARISNVTRAGDSVARLGGDEFAVVCRCARSTDECLAVADRVVDVLRRPFVLRDTTQVVTASVGVAWAIDHHDASQILHEADSAMYAAKRGGRNTVVVHSAG